MCYQRHPIDVNGKHVILSLFLLLPVSFISVGVVDPELFSPDLKPAFPDQDPDLTLKQGQVIDGLDGRIKDELDHCQVQIFKNYARSCVKKIRSRSSDPRRFTGSGFDLSKNFRIRPESDQIDFKPDFMEMVNVPDARGLLLLPNYVLA